MEQSKQPFLPAAVLLATILSLAGCATQPYRGVPEWRQPGTWSTDFMRGAMGDANCNTVTLESVAARMSLSSPETLAEYDERTARSQERGYSTPTLPDAVREFVTAQHRLHDFNYRGIDWGYRGILVSLNECVEYARIHFYDHAAPPGAISF